MNADDPRGEWLRATLEILAGEARGLTPGELWQRLRDRLPTLALASKSDDADSDELTFRWDAAALLEAGWLRRDARRWLITDDGLRALGDFPGADKLAYAAASRMSSGGEPGGKPARVILRRPGVQPVLDAAALMFREGLRFGGSAFAPGAVAWTPQAAEELRTALSRQTDLPSADFIDRLKYRLDGCSDEASLLAAELLTVTMLPLKPKMLPATKRARVRAVLSLLREAVETPAVVDRAFDEGFFPGGVWYSNNVWQMLTFLTEFITYWHTLPVDDRELALAGPAEWREAVWDCPEGGAPAQREALLYLAHPDVFSPILSKKAKQHIVDEFGTEVSALGDDLDANLLPITLVLQAERRGPVDYYAAQYLDRWQPIEPEPPMQRAWLVRGSSVHGFNVVGEWLRDGFVSLAAANLRRLEPDADQAAVKEAVDIDYGHKSYAARQEKVYEFHAFLSRMREGDLLATVSDGALHLGEITGAPTFEESHDNHSNLRRAAEWSTVESPVAYADLPASLAAKLSSQSDVVDLTDDRGLLESLLSSDQTDGLPIDLTLKDADDALADKLLMDKGWLQEVVELLRDRRQLIFYGPPGTGKTYVAQHLAWYLTRDDRSAVKLVQFHPSYSYEDFFEGYRPTPGGNGTLSFELKPGPFRRMVDAARENPSTPYVLIIDEINRANLAKVFGELYFVLEYRDQPVSLLYSQGEDEEFTLPENVFVIGTMNTADRSIALVDAAMRRRFAFIPLHPAEEPVRGLLSRWMQREGLRGDAADVLAALNKRIAAADFAVGPSYFMKAGIHTQAGLDRVWRTSILPLLEELHYGDGLDVADHYDLASLRRGLRAATAEPDEALPDPS